MGNYNEGAVSAAIKASRQKIGKGEARAIHALLRGRDPLTTAAIDSGRLVILKG